MTSRFFGDRIALSRFEREAKVLARLSHPHLVTIYDYGRLGGDEAYLVMERLV
jgi:serine/threonine-protein kinase